jgi:hypothetical protein
MVILPQVWFKVITVERKTLLSHLVKANVYLPHREKDEQERKRRGPFQIVFQLQKRAISL